MNTNKLKRLVKDCIEEIRGHNFPGASGQLAFFLFMSLLPLLTLFSQLLGIFSLSLDTVQSWANINLTELGLSNMESILTESTNASVSGSIITKIILVLTIIWAASKATFSITSITDFINSGGQRYEKGFIARRGRSLVMVLVILIMLVLALAFLVYMPKLLIVLMGKNKAASLAGTALAKLRWLIVLGLYFLTISFVYYSAPSKRVSYKSIIPGSVFSSVGFILVSYVYSLYAKHSLTNNIIYGSLTSVIVLLMWFWFISWIFVIGIVLNKHWGKIDD